MKTYFGPAAGIAVLLFGGTVVAQAVPHKSSGVYLTAEDYKNGQVSFEGDCGSSSHKLELHDLLHKTYIDVTHGTEKHRYAKSELFGFRACDEHAYRFASNFEYQILESKELYIYSQDSVFHGKGSHPIQDYYFSAGPNGSVLALTSQNLKQAVPDNQKFSDSLDTTFGASKSLAAYDKVHKMFKVNWLLIISRE